jgi:Uma2 family endonuclease
VTDVIAPEAEQRRRRQQMRAVARRPMTVDDFLYAYAGVEGRWELVDGEPRMMAGGGIHHGRIARNILIAVGSALRSTGCQPFGSDVGVQVDIHQYRLPDVSILCDPRDTDVDELQRAHFPKVLFEIFSPSTADADRGVKLREYRRIPSVAAIVHIDPVTETVELFERIGPSDWRETVLPSGARLRLDAVGVELSAQDMFRRD